MIVMLFENQCVFLLVIIINLGPTSYRLVTIHPWRTTDGRGRYHKLDLYV